MDLAGMDRLPVQQQLTQSHDLILVGHDQIRGNRTGTPHPRLVALKVGDVLLPADAALGHPGIPDASAPFGARPGHRDHVVLENPPWEVRLGEAEDLPADAVTRLDGHTPEAQPEEGGRDCVASLVEGRIAALQLGEEVFVKGSDWNEQMDRIRQGRR